MWCDVIWCNVMYVCASICANIHMYMFEERNKYSVHWTAYHTYIPTYIHAYTEQYIQHSSEQKPSFLHTWYCNRTHLWTMNPKIQFASWLKVVKVVPSYPVEHLALNMLNIWNSLGKQMVNHGIFSVNSRCTVVRFRNASALE